MVRSLQQRGCDIDLFQLTGEPSAIVERIDWPATGIGLDGKGPFSPIVEALVRVTRRSTVDPPNAILAFSDFADTGNAASLEELSESMSSLDVPIHTVGLGPSKLTDVSVELLAEEQVKVGDPMTVVVAVEQQGYGGEEVWISLEARRLEHDESHEAAPVQHIAKQTVRIDRDHLEIEVPYTPTFAGTVHLTARVQRLAGELLEENNQATRQLRVITDHLRVSYVEYELNWEWQHVKDVFARDRLVGADGFRTYLASAAANVVDRNELFHSQLVPPRTEFFSNDAIFIGDVSEDLLSEKFCELTEEFVSRFGGGLIVVTGPRFGTTELAKSPLASMLPVILHDDAELLDQDEFALQRTGAASRYPFMRLSESEAEDAVAWANLDAIPWYQPVSAVHAQADVLAEHPSALCDDQRTRQPLIAIRPYGRGQVVYLGFNEMWRLKKGFGYRYYQRFWSQLIYRLGMSHAVGAEKRFVVELDRSLYNVGDEAIVTVDAFDDDYQALGMSQLNDGRFVAQVHAHIDGATTTQEVTLPMARPGRFEATIPLDRVGSYSVDVTDPTTDRTYQRPFVVSDSSIELRRVVRNHELQTAIANATGGRAYDISEIDQLLEELAWEPSVEQVQRQITLWTTPAWFVLVAGLMLSEWTIRKLAFLR